MELRRPRPAGGVRQPERGRACPRAHRQGGAQRVEGDRRADIGAVTAAGVREDEVFEFVVCAALGQATRQLDAALAALDRAAADWG